MNPQPNELQKQIQIVNLGSKVVNYNDPQKGQTSFTVYQISGNDGITYETPDQNFFNQKKIGETLTVKYLIKTRTYNGKIYSSYRLITPPKESGSNQIMEALRKTYSRIEEMEENILAAIRLTRGDPNILGPEDVELPKEEEIMDEETEEINKEIQEVKGDADLSGSNPF